MKGFPITTTPPALPVLLAQAIFTLRERFTPRQYGWTEAEYEARIADAIRPGTTAQHREMLGLAWFYQQLLRMPSHIGAADLTQFHELMDTFERIKDLPSMSCNDRAIALRGVFAQYHPQQVPAQ